RRPYVQCIDALIGGKSVLQREYRHRLTLLATVKPLQQKRTRVRQQRGQQCIARRASVGFNVSSSTTVTTSFSVTLASGEKRQIQVGQVWARKSFSWKKSAGCAGNMTTTPGTGIAKMFRRYS